MKTARPFSAAALNFAHSNAHPLQEGYVQCQHSSKLTIQNIRQHFLRFMSQESSYSCQYMAVVRHKDSLPKLLEKRDFLSLCNELEQRVYEKSDNGDDVPWLLQVCLPFVDWFSLSPFVLFHEQLCYNFLYAG